MKLLLIRIPLMAFVLILTSLTANAGVLFGSHLRWFDPYVSDGLSANGIEIMDNTQGPVLGPPPPLDDGDPNTLDYFDEANDEIVHENLFTGSETRISFTDSMYFLTGATMPANQLVTEGQDWKLAFSRPSEDYEMLLDFHYPSTSLQSPLGKFQNDFQVDFSSGAIIPYAVLQTHGLIAPGDYQVQVLLTDTRRTYGNSNAYGAQTASITVTILPASAAVPEPTSVAIWSIALLGTAVLRVRRRDSRIVEVYPS